ncbi:MAG: hypothetical protein M3M96_05545 [Candidatus Eremiobacteraeota bacterium]|nr:hypothetical protein [Candidatus Eremiobacteraeota bacterium]
MSSRQERRAAARGGSAGGGPKKNDPMRAIYVGFAVAIVLVILGFGLFRYKTVQDIKAAYATPTPGPNASAKPIQIKDLANVGKPIWKEGDIYGGGQGSTVDAVKCEATEQVIFHVHSHLDIFDHGTQIQVPKYAGIVPGANGAGCLYWVHTHDGSGIIHIEAPELTSYTLGNFFHIWGGSLSRTAVGSLTGPVTAFVNGSKYDGNLSDIPLTAHQEITLEVGTPVVPPRNYTFPPNE